MPLLTHDETGATSMAKAGVAVAERPASSPAGGSVTAKKNKKAQKKRHRVRNTLYVLLALAILGPVIAFVVGWMIFKVPTADEAAIPQLATFEFADGELLASIRPEVTEGGKTVKINRINVTLDKVPEPVREAVLAAEDASFYSNPGFDIAGIGRAIYNQLTGGIGGGSTITQQYVKVSTDERQPTLLRKYKEVVLAVKISKELQKDQILENYLNTIYFGHGAYGIQAAARSYFDKDAQDLTVSEGAMLAGIIQSPSGWDPNTSLPDTQRRWTFVADQMVDKGWLTPGERAQLTFPTNWRPDPPEAGGVPDDDRYHLYDRAQAELTALNIPKEVVATKGVTVTTTIDSARQKQAVDSVKNVMKGLPKNLRASLVSVDPQTGAILAYYGGSNGLGTDYAEALRQPGSSFKPFVLAAALQGNQNVGLGTQYDGTSGQKFDGGVTVNNSEGVDCAKCDVKYAMTKSINTVFYRMALDVGVRRVIDAAHQAGIPGDLLPEARGGIALGDQEVHPLDMASAYGTFAADGVRHDPYIVAKVVAADGQVLFERSPPSANNQAMPKQVARNVTEAMLGVAASSNIGLADGRVVAVKTGTVQLPGTRDQNKDAWTVGYTPQMSTAVWLGSDLSDPIQTLAGRPIFGRTGPGEIWQQFMSTAMRKEKVENFSPFVPIGQPPSSLGTGDGTGDETLSDDSSDSSDDNSDDDKDKKDKKKDEEKKKKDDEDKKKSDDNSNSFTLGDDFPGLLTSSDGG